MPLPVPTLNDVERSPEGVSVVAEIAEKLDALRAYGHTLISGQMFKTQPNRHLAYVMIVAEYNLQEAQGKVKFDPLWVALFPGVPIPKLPSL